MYEKETNVKHKLQSPRSMERTSLKEHPKSDYTNTDDFRCDPCMKTYKYRGSEKLIYHGLVMQTISVCTSLLSKFLKLLVGF